MKKWIAFLLALTLVFSLVACTEKAPESTVPETTAPTGTTAPPTTEPPAGPDRVGISMPTEELWRWAQDGENMRSQLEAIGYEVDLEFAENDIPTQVSQIEDMIQNGCKVLVITAIDGESLGTVMEQAKDAGVTVIAYDRLIMRSDAVSYYVQFDYYDMGAQQGRYIAEKLDLDHAGDKTYNIELNGGDPGDGNAFGFYRAAMSVLQPYLDAGTLRCLSGQVEFDAVAIRDWSSENAQKRFEELLPVYYGNAQLDAVMAMNDSIAQGVANALDACYRNDVYPIITGMDCDIEAIKNILAGKQAMSIFRDTSVLAEKAVEMVYAILNGREPPINDTESYNNDAIVVPTYLCAPKSCDLSNYEELLLDSGFYTREELFG